MTAKELRLKRKRLLWIGTGIVIVSIIFNKQFLVLSKEHGLTFFILTLFLGIGLIGFGSKLKEKISKLEVIELNQAREQEVRDFLDRISSINLIPQQAILYSNEIGLLIDSVNLYEVKTKRVNQSVGFRLGKAYIGAGQSESMEGWKNVAFGELVLSNKRLIFTGDKRSANIELNKIFSVEIVDLGIRIIGSGNSKPIIFTPSNPTLWSVAIRAVSQSLK